MQYILHHSVVYLYIHLDQQIEPSRTSLIGIENNSSLLQTAAGIDAICAYGWNVTISDEGFDIPLKVCSPNDNTSIGINSNVHFILAVVTSILNAFQRQRNCQRQIVY